MQRRLTFTTNRKHPGIQGPRHWPRSSSVSSQIAFLMRDDNSNAQLWTLSLEGGAPHQVTHFPFDINSAFSWHPDGEHIAVIADGSVWTINTNNSETRQLTVAIKDELAPRGEACIFSPNGKHIAYVQPVSRGHATYNQIFVVESGLA
jgi:Tol biopolymer transport system component